MKWIKVVDKLPPEGEDILVWFQAEVMQGYLRNTMAGSVKKYKPVYEWDLPGSHSSSAEFHEIEWWLPMPEGPNGKAKLSKQLPHPRGAFRFWD